MNVDLDYEAEVFVRSLRAKGRAPTTVTTYLKAIRNLREYLVEHGVSVADAPLDRKTLELFLIAEQDRGLAKQTVHQHYQSLRQFFAFVADANDEKSPLDGMEAPKVPFNPPEVLSVGDLQKLFATASGPAFEDRRDLAILSLFADTGIRRSEMAGIRNADFSWADGIVTVTGKGDKTRGVPFGAATATRLDKYVRVRRKHKNAGSPWFWLGAKGRLSVFGIEDAIQRRGREAGVKVHPHLFRHTFSHMWLDGGGNEGDLMRLAGWSSAQMVQRYGASAAAARAQRAYQKGRSPVDHVERKT